MLSFHTSSSNRSLVTTFHVAVLLFCFTLHGKISNQFKFFPSSVSYQLSVPCIEWRYCRWEIRKWHGYYVGIIESTELKGTKVVW